MKIASVTFVPRRFCAASAAMMFTFLLAGTRAWSAGCFPPPAGLVGWWAAEGNANDSFGTNNGTAQGGLSYAPGEVGQAFSFDGTSAYVSIPASPSLDVGSGAGFTIEGWIKPANVLIANEPIVEWNANTGDSGIGVHLWLSVTGNGGTGALFANLKNPANNFIINSAAGLVTNGAFQHVALTYTKGSGSATATLYYNGAVAAQSPITPAYSPATSYNLYLGTRPGADWFDGLVDEVSIYNGALSQAQIQAIYLAGPAGKCAAPPIITAQPQPVTVLQGTTVSFSAGTLGSRPLHYQWQENMTNIPAAINPTATNSSLVLTNVQIGQSGNIYSLLVTNSVGATNSSDALLTVISPGTCFPPPAGLVSWWAAEGNANDSFGINNGTVVGGAGFAAGEVGQAFKINGLGSFVDIPDSPSLNPAGALTVEAWIFPTGPHDPNAAIVSKSGNNQGYTMEYDAATGGVRFGINLAAGGSVLSPAGPPPPTNVWSHVAGVYDGTNVSFYMNGAFVGSLPASGLIATSPYGLQIGGNPFLPSRYFTGLIDEVSLYNRALSATEVQTIYIVGSAGKCTVPPVITGQPQPVTVFQGSTVSFSVSASGNQPLRYQWLENATNIPVAINPAATNATLVLTNVQPGQSGNSYSVLITNVVGYTNSSNAVLTVLPAGSCLPPPAGLVSWWPAELSGIDIIGTNNGTLIGGVKFTNGEVGQAFNLNGFSQYVDVPDSASLNPTNAVTVEAWINPKSLLVIGAPNSDTPVLKKGGEGLGQSDGYALEMVAAPPPGGSNAVIFGAYVSGGLGWSVPPYALVPTNQWTHVAGVYDGTNVSLYVNGVLVGGPVPAPGTIVPSGNDLQIGHDPSNPPRYFNGLIDEPTVYNTALSAEQIQLIYEAGAAGKCKAPVIAAQPQSVVSDWGYNITLSVGVAGSGTLAYQWEFNGVPIGNATNATLMLDSLQFTNAGAYTVVISDPYGVTTSAPAFLTVNPAGVSLALYPGVTIAGVPGYTYGIQYTTDLSNTNSWLGLTNLTLGQSNVIWYDSVPAAQPQRYYRVLPGPISIP